jgi:hypothetical protein
MQRSRFTVAIFVAGLLLAFACSSPVELKGTGHSDAANQPGSGGAGGIVKINLDGGGTAGAGGPAGTGGAAGAGGAACLKETEYVYTVTSTEDFYKFDPSSLTFSLIGKLDCPGATASPFSMSVDRKGTAWVVFTDGEMYWVDVTTAACSATAYQPGQHGFTTFGMGFSLDAPNGADETLYVSESPYLSGAVNSKGLGKIDTSTLTLTPIATYDLLPNRRAEMTGTGDARVFGAFEGTPYVVAEISKSDARILSQAPQTGVTYAPNSSNFAFAFWGGDFWIFVGPGSYTDVFQYKPKDQTTTKVSHESFAVVGAGVSTCAPLVAPPIP